MSLTQKLMIKKPTSGVPSLMSRQGEKDKGLPSTPKSRPGPSHISEMDEEERIGEFEGP